MRRIELYHALSTDMDAVEWCKAKGLLKRTAVCPTCHLSMNEAPSDCADRLVWRCSRTISGRRHFRHVSIREGSFFSGSKLSLRLCVYLLYEWSVATPVQSCAFELGLSERAVVRHFKMFRKVAALRMGEMQGQLIGGENSVVEVDECQIGRRKAHRGRIPREMWIVGGLLRDSNPQQIFMEVVPKRNRRTLQPLLQRHIRLGTRVITDGWGAYSGLSNLGYRHDVVNHTVNFISPDDPSIHTQGIENVWGCLRRFLRSKGTYTRRDINGYMAEFIFRKHFCDVFESMISTIGMQV